VYVCMYVFMYVCIYVCIYLCIYVCMYLCMCVCMYVFIYVYMLYALYVQLIGFKEYEEKLYVVEFLQSVLEHSKTRKAKVL